MEKNEDEELSKSVSFNLANIFPGDFEFAELSLAANMWKGDMNRLKFKQEGAAVSVAEGKKIATKGFQVLSNLEVTMKPMEIKTFIIMTPSHGIRSQAASKIIFLVGLLVHVKFWLKL